MLSSDQSYGYKFWDEVVAGWLYMDHRLHGVDIGDQTSAEAQSLFEKKLLVSKRKREKLISFVFFPKKEIVLFWFLDDGRRNEYFIYLTTEIDHNGQKIFKGDMLT